MLEVLEVLEVVRQKGELELRAPKLAHVFLRRHESFEPTQSGLLAAERHVSYPGCYDAYSRVEEYEPTWTISWPCVRTNNIVIFTKSCRHTCCCFFILAEVYAIESAASRSPRLTLVCP